MFRFNADCNLLICQKSKIADWIEHFQKFYPGMDVYNLTIKKEFENFISHDVAWSGYHGCTPSIGVINYELAWRRKDLLDLKKGFTLMLDESSLIQNDKAKQTKFIMKLQPSNVILLSGTPCSGKYENLLTQMHLLGWNISKQLYERQYVRWKTVETDGFFHKIVDPDDPYINVERLKSKMREHGAVFKKTEECFDLPEQNFTKVKVKTTKEYKEFIKEGYIQLEDGVELIGDMEFKKRLIARQLCGVYSVDKLEAFRDLVQSTSDRLIVFYNFKDEVKQLIRIANEEQRPWSIVCGDQKTLVAYEEQSDSITFIQYQAGAMGLNLQKANKIIYFTLPERSELFEQSKKRIHRIGQSQPCFYYIMMCEKSVEERIYSTLLQLKDYTDELFKGDEINGSI